MQRRVVGLRSRVARSSTDRLTAAGTGLRTWGRRRWTAAFASALVTVLVVAVPTAMIANPVFGREVPTTAWAWPALLVTSLLSGLLVGTYVRDASRPLPGDAGSEADAAAGGPAGGDLAERTVEGRAGVLGGLLTFLAVGCPVCNKLALLALGYTGAIQWFAPVQPWLAVGAVGLLGWALVRRLGSQEACALPTR